MVSPSPKTKQSEATETDEVDFVSNKHTHLQLNRACYVANLVLPTPAFFFPRTLQRTLHPGATH